MDIYFCDLCGVRVTDVDLKGGHGLRRSHDVICATCLELGHGKDWLAKHSSQPRAAAARPQSAPPAKAQMAMAAAVNSGPSALLDVARDRARTADDDHDHTPAVAPQVLAADDHAVDDEPAEASTESELDSDGDHEITAQVEGHRNTNLAAAASSFSALGSSGATAAEDAPAAPADDLEDQGGSPAEAASDDGAPAEAPAAGEAEVEAAASPFAFKQADETEASPVLVDDSETSEGEEATAGPPKKSGKGPVRRGGNGGGSKDETLPSERPALKADGDGAKKPNTSSATVRKSSAKIGKPGKSAKLSGRGRAKSNNKTVMIVTCITLPLLFAIMAFLQFGSHHTAGPRKTEFVNVSEELKKGIVAARLEVTQALKAEPKTLPVLDSARGKIQGVMPLIEQYEQKAKAAGMSEEDIERVLEGAGWQMLQSEIKPLNDERAKLLLK